MTTTPVRRGRPASLTREQVEDVAFALVQEHGYDSSSMRELARVLGVSAMAVQRATGGREALDEALVDRLFEAELRPATAWPQAWDEVLLEYAQLARRLCLRHPGVLSAFARRPLASPYAQDLVETLLERLVGSGLAPEDAVVAFYTVRDYVTGHVMLEIQRPEQQQPFSILPSRTMVQAATSWLAHHDADERFLNGLRVVLAGVGQGLHS